MRDTIPDTALEAANLTPDFCRETKTCRLRARSAAGVDGTAYIEGRGATALPLPELEPDLESAIDAAIDTWQSGEIGEAVSALSDLARQNPEVPQVHGLLGALLAVPAARRPLPRHGWLGVRGDAACLDGCTSP